MQIKKKKLQNKRKKELQIHKVKENDNLEQCN